MTAGGGDSGEVHRDPPTNRRDEPRSWWASPVGIVTLGFLGVAGYFLITEHTAHVFGALPWLLLAACPLMHLFMHHGHHGGHDHSAGSGHPDSEPEEKP
jgi:peptidoglycan/LPS O-acetylase OafA/YrhL